MRRLSVLLFTLFFIFLFCMGSEHDWTKWRGPHANGISDETGWNPKALQGTSKILWTTNVGKGHSSLVVQGDRLYTMGFQSVISNADTVDEDMVLCLETQTGKEIWRFTYQSEMMRWAGPGATPVLDGNNIYTLNRQGKVFCLNVMDGSVIWKRDIVIDSLAIPQSYGGFCSSPLVVENILLLNAGKRGLALDKMTGQLIWKSELAAGSHATPVLFSYHGKQLAAINGDSTHYAVDIETGEVVWSLPWRTYTDPIPIGDRILLICRDRFCIVKPAKNTPEIIWDCQTIKARSFLNFVVMDGFVYGFCRVKRTQPLQCIDLSSGDVTWSQDLGDWGALIGGDNKLIILDGDGDLIILEATSESYNVLSECKVFPLKHWQTYPHGQEHVCWTAPVLANGKIYARTSWGDMACVDVGQ